MGAAIAERQRRDEVRFADYEQVRRERRLIDELTEASEKLAVPMHNSFEYQLRRDSELYFQDQPIREVLDEWVNEAERLVAITPEASLLLLRAYIERDEYDAMQRLAAGLDDEPDVLVVLSPVPDEVMAGAIDANAYDLDRQKTMLRVHERIDGGIRSTSVSLDRSDRDGLRAIAETFGGNIADDDGSEDILRKRFWGWRKQLGESAPSRLVRRVYDTVLEDKFGGRWHGGRQDAPELEALDFIQQQADLIAAHEQVLDDIERQGGDINRARYNFAAALSRRLRGESDAISLSDAGAEASARGEVYRDDCPTGVSSAAQAAEALGFHRREWRQGSCRVCLKAGAVGECAVCPGCEAADNRGESLEKINQAALRRAAVKQAIAQRASAEAAPHMATSKKDKLELKYGKHAVRGELRTVTGGKAYDVHDSHTGELIGAISA